MLNLSLSAHDSNRTKTPRPQGSRVGDGRAGVAGYPFASEMTDNNS